MNCRFDELSFDKLLRHDIIISYVLNVGKFFAAMLSHDCLKFALFLYRWTTQLKLFDGQL